MPGGFALKLEGLDEYIKQLDTDIIQDELNAELSSFAANVVRDAKENLSQHGNIDRGYLTNSIAFAPLPNGVEIVANCVYAAYVEFGTRKYAAAQVAKLPPEWKAYAATFKGKGGGSFDEFIQAIMAWVQRKGIGSLKTKSGNNSGSRDSLDAMQQAAYAIALNIIQNGSKAHPFLYPAFEHNRTLLLESLRKYFKDKQ